LANLSKTDFLAFSKELNKNKTHVTVAILLFQGYGIIIINHLSCHRSAIKSTV